MRRLLPALACGSLFTDMTRSADATEHAVDKAVVVDAPLDAGWSAWTTREGITGFAPDAQIEPRVGCAFHIFIDACEAAASQKRYAAGGKPIDWYDRLGRLKPAAPAS